MIEPIKKVNSQNPSNSTNLSNRGEKTAPVATKPEPTEPPVEITKRIVHRINGLGTNLKDYKIRELVKDAEEFGPYLKQQRLETNQVRKFLDAVNQMKVILAQTNDFSKIEIEVVLLKPKLAYAAARQKAAKPMSEVMSVAIDKVHSTEDFERFVQLIESIIAYHKAEGGK